MRERGRDLGRMGHHGVVHETIDNTTDAQVAYSMNGGGIGREEAARDSGQLPPEWRSNYVTIKLRLGH